MGITNEKLRKILVKSGLLKLEDFENIQREAEKKNLALDTFLIEKKLVPDDYLGQLIADALGYPYIKLENQKIPDHILGLIPERVARHSKIIAFGTDSSGCYNVAFRDPEDFETLRLVEKKTLSRVNPYFMTERGFQFALDSYKKDLQSLITQRVERSKIVKNGHVELEDVVIEIVDFIFDYAFQNNASDVHIEPREKEIVVRYRIDGILHDVVTIPHHLMNAIVTRIKILAKLRTDEHFAAQDGKLQEIINDERIDIRVSVISIVDGEKVVMRLLSERGKKFDIEDLGLKDSDIKKMRRYMQKSFGMILSTGPTGSGKTTAMYAFLKVLNTRDVNIATIEDPIEYSIEGVNQIQVNPKTGLTFATGLRSIVRQDPDIIMVGEIRDEETAGIAINAAMTGHLVLSTLHTNDAATTLPRFRDMKIEPFLIASTINVIVGQRLVRKICQRCIMSYDVRVDELLAMLSEDIVTKMMGKKKNIKLRLYKGKGCDRCGHSGYIGRIGIFEVLEVDDTIRALIMRDADAGAIMRQAIENGMTTMFEDGVQKSLVGITTLDEVIRVTGG